MLLSLLNTQYVCNEFLLYLSYQELVFLYGVSNTTKKIKKNMDSILIKYNESIKYLCNHFSNEYVYTYILNNYPNSDYNVLITLLNKWFKDYRSHNLACITTHNFHLLKKYDCVEYETRLSLLNSKNITQINIFGVTYVVGDKYYSESEMYNLFICFLKNSRTIIPFSMSQLLSIQQSKTIYNVLLQLKLENKLEEFCGLLPWSSHITFICFIMLKTTNHAPCFLCTMIKYEMYELLEFYSNNIENQFIQDLLCILGDWYDCSVINISCPKIMSLILNNVSRLVKCAMKFNNGMYDYELYKPKRVLKYINPGSYASKKIYQEYMVDLRYNKWWNK